MIQISRMIIDVKINADFKSSIQKKKREAPNLNVDQYTLRYNTLPTTEVEYDYDKFKDEYDHDIDELKKNQAKVNESDFTLPLKVIFYFMINHQRRRIYQLFSGDIWKQSKVVQIKAIRRLYA